MSHTCSWIFIWQVQEAFVRENHNDFHSFNSSNFNVLELCVCVCVQNWNIEMTTSYWRLSCIKSAKGEQKESKTEEKTQTNCMPSCVDGIIYTMANCALKRHFAILYTLNILFNAAQWLHIIPIDLCRLMCV